MLNKLRCHTHFSFSANQIISLMLLIQIHILYDKQCSARSTAKAGISGFSRTRVNYIIVQIIFYFFWDHWAHWGVLENGVLIMYTLEGVNSVANFITAYEESQYNRDFYFLICSMFFVSKGNLLTFIQISTLYEKGIYSIRTNSFLTGYRIPFYLYILHIFANAIHPTFILFVLSLNISTCLTAAPETFFKQEREW